mgnify:CR=1 FL=1
MTTIVNTPTNGESNNGFPVMAAMFIMLAVLLIAFIYFGLPILRRATAQPQITVPDKIDVNVNVPQQQ